MIKRAAVLLPSQLRHLLRVTEATSRYPERDAVILWLGFACGLRVTEIARLTVADVLLPATRLILTWKGGAYELNTKRLKNAAGELVEYVAADSLQAYIKRLYRAAGLPLASSHSGRRTFASRLLAAGNSLDDVQALLGHSDLDHVTPYLAVDNDTLREMFELVL